MHLGLFHLKTAHVDAIEAEQRQRAGVAARGPALRSTRKLRQVKPFNQDPTCHFAPIVKIPGNDERRLWAGPTAQYAFPVPAIAATARA